MVALKRKKATTVTFLNGETVVVLYSTPIVRYSDKKIILNTGGWRTSTTKNRMNQASKEYGLGYTVYQKNFDWYVSYRGEEHTFESNSVTLER